MNPTLGMLIYSPSETVNRWRFLGNRKSSEPEVQYNGPCYYYVWTENVYDNAGVNFRDEEDNVLARLEDDGEGYGSFGPLAIAPASEFEPAADPYADVV